MRETIAETGLTRNQMIAQLTKSTHGELKSYVETGLKATVQDPEFMAHLIAWNQVKGQIRDSKIALPVVTLAHPGFPAEFIDNSLAHLALLEPRSLLKAMRFAKDILKPAYTVEHYFNESRVQDGMFDTIERATEYASGLIGCDNISINPIGSGHRLKRLVRAYLASKEKNWAKWERLAVQHRSSLKELYALFHVKPNAMAEQILFHGDYPKGTVFEVIANLKNMPVTEAAGHIMEKRIPFLIALGALGPKAKEPDLVMALINRMSPTELVTNTKMLERLGVKTVPALRAAYEHALERTAKSKKTTFKATRAAEAVEDETLKAKLQSVQEKQIKALSGIEGNWLVLGDKSGSMSEAIEIAKQVAATLARLVKGKVHLIFFNTTPTYLDATGKDYDVLLVETRYVRADGGTSIGCGLQYALDRDLEIDGIAIVSDAQENNPPRFTDCYKRYCEKNDKQVPVYLYRVNAATRGWGDLDLAETMRAAGHDLQEFDLRGQKIDYYALPNLIQTMRTNRYSLGDEIMAQPLLKLENVLNLKGELAHA